MERADLDQWKAREVARLLALVETERRYYQEIVASIPVGLLVLSTDLAIVSANRAIRKIFGLRSSESVRGRLDTLLPGWVLDRVQTVLQTGVAQTDILVEPEREGRGLLRIGILAIRNWDDETAQEALLTIEDLTGLGFAASSETAQQAAEVPVPEPEAPGVPASEIINNLDAIVWAVELRGYGFLFVSEHAEKMLGFPVNHWTSATSFWSGRVYAADREGVVESYRRAIERGEGNQCEFRAVAADGRILWLRESARLVTDPDGRPSYLIGITVDVTERRQLEDQLVQSERVEAVARLASRMAHDLNNMLMILTGYGEELLNGLAAGSPLRADVQEILTATERMSGLTNQLLAFARRQGPAAQTIELETVVGHALENLQGSLGERIEIELALDAQTNRVKADAGQLDQLIASMLERAREHMPEGGKIRVATSRVEIHEDMRRTGAPLKPGLYGVITVEDTGRPIDADVRACLFESFLPGKEFPDGLAAALARGYALVRQWGGDISVTSEPAQGSVFRIFLECVDAAVAKVPEPSAAEPVAAPAEPAARLETILVVEDEAGIRALVRKILRRQGYEVIEAASGDEALKICLEHQGAIDLLITDVMMPQMGGRELVDRLRERCGDMKVLYVSGYTDDAAIYSGNFPPGTAFLQKPFTLGSLLEKVKEVLSAQVT